MEAKDTVMGDEQIFSACGEEYMGGSDMDNAVEVAKAQAEISFKAGMKKGMWLYATWLGGMLKRGETGFTEEEWQTKLKEWGIE